MNLTTIMRNEMERVPLVTVITLTYNHGSYIAECLDSLVKQQTDFPFEVIVHDDASTDCTPDIIRKYHEEYPDIIRPVLQTENQYSRGVAIGQTFIYPRIRSRYVAYCEGDDYWTDPMKLQKQVDFLESHPEYSMCCTEVNWLIQKTGQMSNLHYYDKQELELKDFMLENYVSTLTVLARTEYVLDFNFNVLPGLPHFMMGDYPLWIYLAVKGKVRKLPEATAVYRELSGSMSHSRDKFKRIMFEISAYDIRYWFNRKYGIESSWRIWKRERRALRHLSRSLCPTRTESRKLYCKALWYCFKKRVLHKY